MGPGPPTDGRAYAELLERDEFIETLEARLGEAEAGRGQMVLVEGEAGIGKTALARAFCARIDPRTRVLWGACDGLRTPRVLGPLVDIAGSTDGPLSATVHRDEKPAGCFAALVRELQSSAPTVLVVEDVHWADEATLDVLTMLGRRAHTVPALTIVTYRAEGLAANDPLREAVGELGAAADVSRVALPALSAAAVTELAAPVGLDGGDLHRRTAGNPFFVTEVLSAAGAELPATIRDAVLARLARLGEPARRALDTVAIAPYPMEPWLLEAMLGDDLAQLEESLAAGILVSEGPTVAFRHELTRLAVEESISAVRAVPLHQRLLQALDERAGSVADPARLAHHAEAAGDRPAVWQFACAAAEQAAGAGAHREAAAQYARAHRHAEGVEPDEHGEMLLKQAEECHMIADFDAAIGALEIALDLYRRLGDRVREGRVLRKLSATLYCMGGGAPRADAAIRSAIEILQTLPPGPDLAMAYMSMASGCMNAENAAETFAWGSRSAAIDEQPADPLHQIRSLNDLGTMEYLLGRDSGREKLEQSLALARDTGYEDDAGRAYIHLCWAAVRNRDYARVATYVRDGLRYCTDRDLDLHRLYLHTHWGRAALDLGRWDEAADAVAIVIGDRRSAPDALAPALSVQGMLRARRGEPDAWEPLDAALALLEGGDLQRTGPVAIARAEALWLEGRHAEIDAETAPTLSLALDRQAPWIVGELAIWRWRSGVTDALPAGAVAEPYALSIAGDGTAAARRWRELGCPYEAALAVADAGAHIGAGAEDAARRSVDELAGLGARPAVAIVTRRLRRLGVRGLPRGPRRQTRAHPAGLTAREIEVLSLLTEGLRNAQIAERLVVSEKTVDHHVSAILRKLDVHTRGEATAKAHQLGLEAATPAPAPVVH